MNRILTIAHPWATLCLMLTLLASCSEKTIDPSTPLPPTDATPIAFSTEDAFTKAVISDVADLQADPNGFRVWGWFEGITSGHMFYEDDQKRNDGTTVTYTNSTWTYSPTRYWMNGTYDFAAIYPAAVTTVEGETTTTTPINGTYAPASGTTVLTVPNFDVTTQADLCVAFNTNIDGSNPPIIDEETGAKGVALNFQHTLSLVQIELKLDKADFFECETDDDGKIILDEETGEPNIVVENGEKQRRGYGRVAIAGLNNIAATGNLSANKQTDISLNWETSGTIPTLRHYNTATPVELSDVYAGVLGDGLLVIPQEIKSNEELYVNVMINFPGVTDNVINKEYIIPLKDYLSKWEPNKKYIIQMTVTQEFLINFSVTTINDWNNERLGDFTIGDNTTTNS